MADHKFSARITATIIAMRGRKFGSLWVNQLSGDSTFHLPLSRPGQKGGAAAAVGWPRGLFGASISQGMVKIPYEWGKNHPLTSYFRVPIVIISLFFAPSYTGDIIYSPYQSYLAHTF